MVHICICLYMYIVYFHFCGAFVIFAVIILCFSVDTIFSAYWRKLRVLFVQLKMLWSQTQDNGHAGSMHLCVDQVISQSISYINSICSHMISWCNIIQRTEAFHYAVGNIIYQCQLWNIKIEVSRWIIKQWVRWKGGKLDVAINAGDYLCQYLYCWFNICHRSMDLIYVHGLRQVKSQQKSRHPPFWSTSKLLPLPNYIHIFQ